MKVKVQAGTVAHAFLELLSLRGVDYFFANAGTDFASLQEAFACREEQGKDLPRPMAIPHEIPLVGMAHGYYLGTGRPQAAMVHVNVGTANSLGGLMAAQRSRVPILFCAGRTPITEEGSPASRTAWIHWGQESFDQAAMVREYVKWDYELRTPSQLETVVDRALAMAMTEPRGPVYLTLPREVLFAPMDESAFQVAHRYDLPTFYPDPEKIEAAAELIMKAQFPIIITSAVGCSQAAVEALTNLAETMAVGVISLNPEHMNFPTSHPCHLGFSPAPHIKKADVIIVIDCAVPWYPNVFKPEDTAKIIQVGIDPFYSRYPIRGFFSDLTLQGEPALALSELNRVAAAYGDKKAAVLEKRRQELEKIHDDMMRGWESRVRRVAQDKPLDYQWVSHNVRNILGDDTVLVNEYGNAMIEQDYDRPGSYFGSPHTSYLGWSLGAALGIKLALPDNMVVATVGDGTYMFSVPSACHFISKSYRLPILIIVYNNQCWHAVKRSTKDLHPDGVAVRRNRFSLSELQPTADYEKICEVFGGYGERVEDPGQVGPALERAVYAVMHEKRQAVLNMICKHP